jgi:hypothetical protein
MFELYLHTLRLHGVLLNDNTRPVPGFYDFGKIETTNVKTWKAKEIISRQ